MPLLEGGAPLHDIPRTVTWRSRQYRFERLRTRSLGTSLPPVWDVSRGGEFIGTMAGNLKESTKEFEVRAMQWLGELFGYGTPDTT